MKILKWIIALPFIALALFVLARFALCRPNYFTVKTATPMVEKIADYIVVNGIPESLDKIPDLPNKLENCKSDVNLEKKVNDDFEKVSLIKKSDYVRYEQTCTFYHKNKSYEVWLWFERVNSLKQGILQISSNYTYVETKIDNKNKRTKIYSWLKHHGILCSSFKQ